MKKIKDAQFKEVAPVVDDAPREFFVGGLPKTKGSGRGIPFIRKHGPKAGKMGVRVINDNPDTASWETLVRYAAQQHGPKSGPWEQRPVSLVVTFRLPKPAAWGKGKLKRLPQQPWKKPDLDKLLRTIKDALKGVIYKDDAMVCAVLATKIFCRQDEGPGVRISASCFD